MPFAARYKGRCSVCHCSIHEGDRITYTRANGARHSACSARPQCLGCGAQLRPIQFREPGAELCERCEERATTGFAGVTAQEVRHA